MQLPTACNSSSREIWDTLLASAHTGNHAHDFMCAHMYTHIEDNFRDKSLYVLKVWVHSYRVIQLCGHSMQLSVQINDKSLGLQLHFKNHSKSVGYNCEFFKVLSFFRLTWDINMWCLYYVAWLEIRCSNKLSLVAAFLFSGLVLKSGILYNLGECIEFPRHITPILKKSNILC